MGIYIGGRPKGHQTLWATDMESPVGISKGHLGLKTDSEVPCEEGGKSAHLEVKQNMRWK